MAEDGAGRNPQHRRGANPVRSSGSPPVILSNLGNVLKDLVMERAADHRVANGLPALPDVAPATHAAKLRVEIPEPATAQLSLPFQRDIRDQK